MDGANMNAPGRPLPTLRISARTSVISICTKLSASRTVEEAPEWGRFASSNASRHFCLLHSVIGARSPSFELARSPKRPGKRKHSGDLMDVYRHDGRRTDCSKRQASRFLNANYIATRLSALFSESFTKDRNGRVAHECILDLQRLEGSGPAWRLRMSPSGSSIMVFTRRR